MPGFLTASLVGLILLLIGGAMMLVSAVGFGAKPNRRAAIGFLVSTAASVGGWLLLQG